MLTSFRNKPFLNEKHKQILESLNDLDNFNVDLISSLSRTDDTHDSSLVKVNDSDTHVLKKNILFKNWHTETFNKFIEEKHVCVRKMKYKQVVAHGKECHEKLFVIKSGEMLIWIKVSKNHVKNYQKKLSKYLVKEKLPQSDLKKAKSRFKRDRMVDIDSIDFPTNNKPQLRRSESMTSMASVRSQNKVNEPPQEELKNDDEDDDSEYLIHRIIVRKSFSAFAKSTNDLHVQLTIRSMSSMPSRRVYEFNSRRNQTPQQIMNNKEEKEKKTELVETKYMKQEVEKRAHFSDKPIEIKDSSDESDSESDDSNCKNDFKNELLCKPASFIKMMKLNPGEIFGLSDILFDDTQSNERDDSSNNGGSSKKKNLLNDTDSEDENKLLNSKNEDAESVNGRELNSKNLLNYYFISNSRQLDCYVIDKEYYVKNMQTFTEDKNIISKYLQTLRNECVRTPGNDLIDQSYVQQMSWNQHRKKILNEQIKHNLLKKPSRPIIAPSKLKLSNQNKKFHF